MTQLTFVSPVVPAAVIQNSTDLLLKGFEPLDDEDDEEDNENPYQDYKDEAVRELNSR